MEISFFTSNLTNPSVLIPEIYKEWNSYFQYKAFREYDPKLHKINFTEYRADKIIELQRPMEDGKSYPYQKTEKVTRLSLPYQELITLRANAFLTMGGMNIKAKPKNEAERKTYDKLIETLADNKMFYQDSVIGETLYSQTEACEIWYSEVEDGKVELKCAVYKPSEGYQMIPVFNERRSLMAFGLGYKKLRNKKEIDCLDVYTKDRLIKYEKIGGSEWTMIPFKTNEDGLVVEDSIPLLYGKIPVVFYQIQRAIWENVQPTIERQELLKSNFSDTNDYNGSPILFAEGEIKGFSAKGETGKVIEGENGAKLSYVESANSPEMIRMEMENNENDIFTMTQTPNLSFEALSKISGQLSAPIMDRMLTDAHLKAKKMQNGEYGLGIQRRLNFLITAISNIFPECKGGQSLSVTPVFELFRVGGFEDKIDLLVTMKKNGLIDDETAVQMNPYVDDPKAVYEKIVKRENEILAASKQ